MFYTKLCDEMITKPLSPNEQKIFFCLLKRVKYGGKVFLSQEALAERTKIPRTKVSQALKKLRERNFVFNGKTPEGKCFFFNEEFIQKGKTKKTAEIIPFAQPKKA